MLDRGEVAYRGAGPSSVSRREHRQRLHERDASAVSAGESCREHEEERRFVDVGRKRRSEAGRARREARRPVLAELREERRIADDDVECAVGEVRRERVSDDELRVPADGAPARVDRSRIGVETDQVPRRAETTRRSDEEVPGAARGVEQADGAGVASLVEERLQRPVEQSLDEERRGVERAEATLFARTQARAGRRLIALYPLTS